MYDCNTCKVSLCDNCNSHIHSMGSYTAHRVVAFPVSHQGGVGGGGVHQKNTVDILYLEKERAAMIQSVGHLIEKENARKQELERERTTRVNEIKGVMNGFIKMLRFKCQQLIAQVNY